MNTFKCIGVAIMAAVVLFACSSGAVRAQTPAGNAPLAVLNYGSALPNYEFVSLGTSTLTGYFINNMGLQVSPLVTAAITTTPVGFSTIAGGTIPATAVGFIGSLSGSNLAFARAGTTYTPTSSYPQIVAAAYITFGQVV